ncbi:MAG: class 1 fructose-bisphosphatase [Candidatus Binataceae bacterium]
MRGTTLTRHALTRQGIRVAAGDLALILGRIEILAERISRELARASINGRLGYTGETNVQGENVKKLDEWTHEVILEAFERGHPVCSLVSEEMEKAHHNPANCRENSYVLLYDPLDGSSNTDVNAALGTIFSVRKRPKNHGTGIDDILRPGDEQVIAGYILYGPSTQLVYTAGAGVDIFTFDQSVDEFILWRENVKMPQRGSTYAVNQGNITKFHPNARKFIEHLTSRKDKSTSYSLRYSGAFAADFHRCMLEGGLYMYPGEVTAEGKTKGKLRLMYELAPLSFIAEQAGGKGSIGKGRVLDVVPSEIHQRQPVYIGSADEIDLAERMQVEG